VRRNTAARFGFRRVTQVLILCLERLSSHWTVDYVFPPAGTRQPGGISDDVEDRRIEGGAVFRGWASADSATSVSGKRSSLLVLSLDAIATFVTRFRGASFAHPWRRRRRSLQPENTEVQCWSAFWMTYGNAGRNYCPAQVASSSGTPNWSFRDLIDSACGQAGERYMVVSTARR